MDGFNVLERGNKWPELFGTIQRCMPSFLDTTLRALRLRYNAAYSAHQSCVNALNEAALSGQAASPELVRNEAIALRQLTEARRELRIAMEANNDRSV